MNSIYRKSETLFAVVWIAAYCVLMSVGDMLSEKIGAEKSVTLAIALALSALLVFFLWKNGLFKKYGFCRPKAAPRSMLYYFPIALMLSANLWCGVALNFGAIETVIYIFTMLCVGFLEEVIFRGLLFEAMRKSNLRAAIIISALTFGIGHIINLVNGSGAELVPNLLQIVYATAAGFMFVLIFYKTKSIIVCIGAHGMFNALSAFSNEAALTMQNRIITAVFLTLVTGGYAIYLAVTLKKTEYN